MGRTSIWMAIALVPLAMPALAENTWHFDGAHSGAQFKIKHMMVSNVNGTIRGVNGSAQYDGKNVKALQVDATLDATTIATGEPNRDKHLRSDAFFDVEKYPTITFKSKKVVAAEHGKYKLVGDLTMHGVTKEVALDMDKPSDVFKDAKGNEHIGTEAHTTVNRTDYGISWNKTLDQGGVMVGDPVDITLDVELVKDKETASKDGKNSG
ncbi:MAG TPA: YceI family protein [Candidatus Obscuribacterales bacterium]